MCQNSPRDLEEGDRQRRRVVHVGEVVVAAEEHVHRDDGDGDARHQRDLRGQRADLGSWVRSGAKVGIQSGKKPRKTCANR